MDQKPFHFEGSKEGPWPAYLDALRTGRIEENQSQRDAANRLQKLFEYILDKNKQPSPPPGLWNRFFKKKPKVDSGRHSHKGFYFHGPVGVGKTLLMDLFAGSLPKNIVLRQHYHRFMFDVHERLHNYRLAEHSDPLTATAEAIAAHWPVLCLDEFFVNNIADAMILSRLFEMLFARGQILITTSNSPPNKLYHNGLQRERFLPFIDLLYNHTYIYSLQAEQDYRRGFTYLPSLYLSPLGRTTEARFFDAFRTISQQEKIIPENLELSGRKVEALAVTEKIAMFRFGQLCSVALGATDYQQLCERFNIFFIADIPELSDDRRDEVRRFITLIDILYDNQKLCFFSAHCNPDQIYTYGEDKQDFLRTASRISEMRSPNYLTRIDKSFRLTL